VLPRGENMLQWKRHPRIGRKAQEGTAWWIEPRIPVPASDHAHKRIGPPVVDAAHMTDDVRPPRTTNRGGCSPIPAMFGRVRDVGRQPGEPDGLRFEAMTLPGHEPAIAWLPVRHPESDRNIAIAGKSG